MTPVANSRSTDGGGIRGLVSLLILQKILLFIRDEEHKRDKKLAEAGHQAPRADERDKDVPLACHYFSFMFGTSTGGYVHTKDEQVREKEGADVTESSRLCSVGFV